MMVWIDDSVVGIFVINLVPILPCYYLRKFMITKCHVSIVLAATAVMQS